MRQLGVIQDKQAFSAAEVTWKKYFFCGPSPGIFLFISNDLWNIPWFFAHCEIPNSLIQQAQSTLSFINVVWHIVNKHSRGLLHKTFTGEKKKSGYFNRSFLPMIMSMGNLCLPEFSDFTRVFSPVKVLGNGPQLSSKILLQMVFYTRSILWMF